MNEKSEYLKIEYDGVRYNIHVEKVTLLTSSRIPSEYLMSHHLLNISDYAIRLSDNIVIKNRFPSDSKDLNKRLRSKAEAFRRLLNGEVFILCDQNEIYEIYYKSEPNIVIKDDDPIINFIQRHQWHDPETFQLSGVYFNTSRTGRITKSVLDRFMDWATYPTECVILLL